MDEIRPARRSMFRFGIRDLLWAMVVMGLVVGRWMDHQRQSLMVRSEKHRVSQLQSIFRSKFLWEVTFSSETDEPLIRSGWGDQDVLRGP
jgi:hypothetical protein